MLIRISEFGSPNSSDARSRGQKGADQEYIDRESSKAVAHIKISGSAPTDLRLGFDRGQAHRMAARHKIRLKPDQSGGDCQVDVQ
jgi:hypothetical protein